MSRTPPLWIEARCGSVTGAMGDNWIIPTGCHETANEGGFFSSIAKARKHHINQGWEIVHDEWWCPVCARVLPQ